MKVVWRPEPAALTKLIPYYAAQPHSYAEVGATETPQLPAGYHHVNHSVALAADQFAFDRATDALMTWAMHKRAGLTLAASAERAEAGVTTVMTFGSRLVGLLIPCRVVWTVNEPDRRGFAYGTLPGHPESGEEAFIIERASGGEVTLSIRAFSKPGHTVVRAGSAISRLVQGWMTDRYGRSLADLTRA